MSMTVEAVAKRKQTLTAGAVELSALVRQLESQLETAKRNLAATSGGIQECDFWLAALADEKKDQV